MGIKITRVDVVVIVAWVTIMVLLLFSLLAHGVAVSKRVQCLNNLKNDGLAFIIFAQDHTNGFPWQIQTNIAADPRLNDDVLKYFLAVTNEFSVPNLLHCSADTAPFTSDWSTLQRTNVSYFLGVDALNGREKSPSAWLSGDRNLTMNTVRPPSGLVTVPANTTLGWDRLQHRFQGNLLTGDGSVHQLNNARLANSKPGLVTLAIP